MRSNLTNKLLVSLTCLLAATLSACGGSEGSDSSSVPAAIPAIGTIRTPGTSETEQAADGESQVGTMANACAVLPPMPSKPSRYKNVRDFGARGDDSLDDTTAIERALAALQPGEWLVFPAGRYIHSRSLRVRTENVVLWSDRATLHATNPRDQAIWLDANGASVYGFTLTAVTDRRRTAPWESRIAIFGGSTPRKRLYNNVVRRNRVVWGGDPNTKTSNSASSAGIFVYNATKFLIAENSVSRSLADGIHITAASSNGRVLKNYVKETGDDMIAMVSYIGEPNMGVSEEVSVYPSRRATELVHDILVAGNEVSGQYWGRGISVVGGENITIENNNISRTTHAAGVYLARETGYFTFGVRNVIVRNNRISEVQTTMPDYVDGGVSRYANKAGHGAIEIYSYIFSGEAGNSYLKDKLAVQQIRVEDNVIRATRNGGIRMGVGTGKYWTEYVRRDDGSRFARTATGGKVGLLGIYGNQMSQISGSAVDVRANTSYGYNVMCSGNTDDGNGTSHPRCGGARPNVTGAAVSCG